MTLDKVVQAASNQVSCDVEGQTAILNIGSGVYYGLDPVGAAIWKLMEQPRSVASLRDAVLEEFDIDSERCERDLFDLLDKLAAEGLIEVRETRMD
jgi:hypothetical protein